MLDQQGYDAIMTNELASFFRIDIHCLIKIAMTTIALVYIIMECLVQGHMVLWHMVVRYATLSLDQIAPAASD